MKVTEGGEGKEGKVSYEIPMTHTIRLHAVVVGL